MLLVFGDGIDDAMEFIGHTVGIVRIIQCGEDIDSGAKSEPHQKNNAPNTHSCCRFQAQRYEKSLNEAVFTP